MKAFFEMSPYFKAIIDIPFAYREYAFALLEDNNEISFKPLDITDVVPASIKKMVFFQYGYKQMVINEEHLYMPHYRFSRVD